MNTTKQASSELVQVSSEGSNEEKPLHPAFSSSDGDIILGAKDGTLFRVHSYTLKTTSGWFRAMFSLPQRSISPPSDMISAHSDTTLVPFTSTTPDIIYVDEDAHTIEILLRMACGLPLLHIDSYDTIDPLLYAAEKYDMPGPMSICRLLVMMPHLSNQPFRLYAVACRYGWDPEAKFASTETLTHNIHAAELRPLLQKLGIDAVLNLFELHHSRRETLRRRLDCPPFVGGGPAACVQCGAVIDYHTWRELKYKIILEMDVRPLGDTILDTGLVEWPEGRACWTAKCPNVECDRFLYDKGETLRVIRECIDGLRKCI